MADFINKELQRPAESLLYSLRQTTHQSGDSTEVVLYIQKIASYIKQTLEILPCSSAAAESYLVLAHTWPHMENIHVECLNTLTSWCFFKLWTFSIKISVAINTLNAEYWFKLILQG